jgi:phosphohistidine phosphatase
MRTLTLMRHAKSSWDDIALADHKRPLNRRGEKAAVLMAKRLKEEGYVPDLVLVSSARRTQQTAETMQNIYGGHLQLVTEPILYEASPADYMSVIRRVDDTVSHLMMIGHNPTIEQMASMLSDRDVRMPTAAYIRFEIPTPWREFTITRYNETDYDFPKSRR